MTSFVLLTPSVAGGFLGSYLAVVSLDPKMLVLGLKLNVPENPCPISVEDFVNSALEKGDEPNSPSEGLAVLPV